MPEEQVQGFNDDNLLHPKIVDLIKSRAYTVPVDTNYSTSLSGAKLDKNFGKTLFCLKMTTILPLITPYHSYQLHIGLFISMYQNSSIDNFTNKECRKNFSKKLSNTSSAKCHEDYIKLFISIILFTSIIILLMN
jgi:hypothetical protein